MNIGIYRTTTGKLVDMTKMHSVRFWLTKCHSSPINIIEDEREYFNTAQNDDERKDIIKIISGFIREAKQDVNIIGYLNGDVHKTNVAQIDMYNSQKTIDEQDKYIVSLEHKLTKVSSSTKDTNMYKRKYAKIEADMTKLTTRVQNKIRHSVKKANNVSIRKYKSMKLKMTDKINNLKAKQCIEADISNMVSNVVQSVVDSVSNDEPVTPRNDTKQLTLINT